jgi:diguanylate cyclase (GGDEF)-like protein
MAAPSDQSPAPNGEDSPMPEALSRRSTDERTAVLTRRYGDALRVGDPVRAFAATDVAIAGGMTAAGTEARVIAPAMRWIGDLWESGALGVADEHLATAISDGALAHLYPRLQTAEPRSRERVMVATVQGERHVLGPRMVADVLEGAGFDVLYLGGDVPSGALLDACRKHRPAVVALGVTMRVNLPALLGEVTALASFDDPPRIVLGGQGIPAAVGGALDFPVLASSEEVVEAVEQLLREPPGVVPPSPSLLIQVITEILPEGGDHGDVDALAERFAAAALAAADTAREQARRALAVERLALRDPLTDLWNRRAFDDRFDELVQSTGGDVAVAKVDVDGFKAINDRDGQEIGDRVLVEVARALRASVRPEDFTARLGGDELAVLLPVADTDAALEIGERIRAAVEASVTDPPVTVSVGLTGFHVDRRLTALEADRALFRAKAGGRNRVVVATPGSP